MRYRLNRPEDSEALYAIETICFQPPQRFSRAYLEQVTRARHGATWVAEGKDGRLAGFAVVEWKRLRTGGVAGYVVTIEVLPEERRQGVGGELLRKVEGAAEAAGAEAIWLHVDERNVEAQRLYRRHGYMEAGTASDFYGPGQGAQLLVKALRRKT